MHLALAQLEIEGGRVDANVERAVDAIAEAAADGADLVALPELFAVGYFAFDAYQRAAEPLDGPTIERIREAAIEHGVAVLAGTIVEDLAATAAAGPAPGDVDGTPRAAPANPPAEAGLANTAVLLDSAGERRLVYRKHHLFGYDSREAELLVPGERIETASIAGLTVGVTTCYDLRFPELYRELVDAGAELVLVPSAWPYPRVEHWQVLPRARAVENLLYVGAVNGAATFGDEALVGRSAVYDPWGTPVATIGEEPGLVTAEVDLGRVERVREEFPVLGDRREW